MRALEPEDPFDPNLHPLPCIAFSSSQSPIFRGKNDEECVDVAGTDLGCMGVLLCNFHQTMSCSASCQHMGGLLSPCGVLEGETSTKVRL
eukprot:138389-Amphidinium_carterae.1